MGDEEAAREYVRQAKLAEWARRNPPLQARRMHAHALDSVVAWLTRDLDSELAILLSGNGGGGA